MRQKPNTIQEVSAPGIILPPCSSVNYQDHPGYLPTFAIVTTGKVHEQKVAPQIPLEKGDVAVFDRAYTNFNWYATLCDKDI
jgi:hypothetical protein